MESKVKSALWALDNGCSVVICNGMKYNTIRKIMYGQKIGTFFSKSTHGEPTEILAKNARTGSRKLATLSPDERAEIISMIADGLLRDELIDFTPILIYTYIFLPTQFCVTNFK